MNYEFKIGRNNIGQNNPPFIIAEMSGNHNQSLDRAMAIVDAAASSGADAIKLQTYTPETMTLNLSKPGFVINDPNSLWAGRQLYDLYTEAYTPWEWHRPLMERAASHGLQCFSTPFDDTAVDFLEQLGVPAYKIASFENVDLPLIRRVARTGKPMIISTGMASAAEIDEAVRAAREAGNRDLVLLKCTSTYPATPANTNLRTIPSMRDTFGCQIGLSDHTMGCGVAVAAVAFGAPYSKGNQSAKEAIDRIGGSGVFARDPDVILTMTPHEEQDAYVIDLTLRALPQVPPLVVRWRGVSFERDADADASRIRLPGKEGKIPSTATYRRGSVAERYGSIFEKMPPKANHKERELSEVLAHIAETVSLIGEPADLGHAAKIFDVLRNKRYAILRFVDGCWIGRNHPSITGEGGAS
jgi:N-acetylneuraminate synthase